MTDIERSHAEFRAALRSAGRRIAQLNFVHRDGKVLAIMRRIWRDSRAVVSASKSARGAGAGKGLLGAADITA